jgi:small subunit ribosomal protein S5
MAKEEMNKEEVRVQDEKPRGQRAAPRRQKREEAHSDLKEKVLFVNRCSKTVTGGKKMSFSALILVGDGKGRVGYGFAKANELTDAIRKGGELARKNMKNVVMEGTTVPHEAWEKQDGAMVFIRPAPEGTGIIAGSKVRAILEFAGFENVMAKSFGSSNPINQVRACFKALMGMTPRKKVLQARGLV